jgi:hypothetical protein
MVKQVQSVLGVLGYQRPFIPHFADIAKPLTTLMKKDQAFVWTSECRTALDTLIEHIMENSGLRQPDLDAPFYLQVDVSVFAMGAMLTQQDNRGKHFAISFHSQTFNDAKRNYDIYDCELLAVVRAHNGQPWLM